ncbi:MAG: alpha/beta hydrolase fold domain-containing protein, partial [Burkholderiaceae bacterium]
MLTQQIATLIERIAQAGQPPMHTLTAQAARAFYEKAGTILVGPTPALLETRHLEIPNRDGHRMRATLWVPSVAARGVLLYFHGGGFTIGSPTTHAGLCQQLAVQANCAVLSVDYRLAPEHPFPAAVHDAFDALAWL